MRNPKDISINQLLERAIQALDRSQYELANFASRMNKFEAQRAEFRHSHEFASIASLPRSLGKLPEVVGDI